MRVAFVHPDLGIGGAERLVVDAALALNDLGHHCTIYTAHYDPARSFREVAPPNPKVAVKAIWLPVPRTVCGRLHAVLAAIRCALIAFYVCVLSMCDVAVVDLVSLPLVVFAAFRVPALFYCHFPDKLLEKSLRRSSPSRLRSTYRHFIDAEEAISMRCASAVCCNSRFTAEAFGKVFPQLPLPQVVYPCVATDTVPSPAVQPSSSLLPSSFLLSLNRYERKKNIALAVRAFGVVANDPDMQDLVLVIAGGYDDRLPENVAAFDELTVLARTLGVERRISFLRNVDDAYRAYLLRSALAVLYTPAEEHFGIVPLEAMAAGTPVIAVASGGPCESVVHEGTGLLCPPTPNEFADAVRSIVTDPDKAIRYSENGIQRVQQLFSRKALGNQFHRVLLAITEPSQ